MLLAEIEVRHSRPIAPTRRVALGDVWLPAEPAPGFGGILLAGVVGVFAPTLDTELREGLDRLIDDLEAQRRTPQPRLRHRFQNDVVGLDRSTHRLLGVDHALVLELQRKGSPAVHVLAAVYAARELPEEARPATFRLLRRAMHWIGTDDAELLRYLIRDEAAFAQWQGEGGDADWALQLFGFPSTGQPDRSDVLRRFRDLVRVAHPDSGATDEGAGRRITDLTKAKSILLETVS